MASSVQSWQGMAADFSLSRSSLSSRSVGTAFVVAIAIVHDSPVRYGLIVLLALAMGLQNAAARLLAIPDLTTTVLTSTLTGLAADSTLAGGNNPRAGRRLLATGAMLLGAAVGALLVLRFGVVPCWH